MHSWLIQEGLDRIEYGISILIDLIQKDPSYLNLSKKCLFSLEKKGKRKNEKDKVYKVTPRKVRPSRKVLLRYIQKKQRRKSLQNGEKKREKRRLILSPFLSFSNACSHQANSRKHPIKP